MKKLKNISEKTIKSTIIELNGNISHIANKLKVQYIEVYNLLEDPDYNKIFEAAYEKQSDEIFELYEKSLNDLENVEDYVRSLEFLLKNTKFKKTNKKSSDINITKVDNNFDYSKLTDEQLLEIEKIL